jgi:hypothetical protein
LIVETIRKMEASKPSAATKAVPRSRRLLMDVIRNAIDEVEFTFKPFHDGPAVRAVMATNVRARLYAKIAEKADSAEDPVKVAERQRKAFSRAIEAEINAKTLLAGDHQGNRVLWLP